MAGKDASVQHAEAGGNLHSSQEAFIVHIYAMTWLSCGEDGDSVGLSWSWVWTGVWSLAGNREEGAYTWKQAGIRKEVQGEKLSAGQTQGFRDIHLMVWSRRQCETNLKD